MSELGGAVFGIVGALAAFPRRIAAREVERQGGHLRRGVGRGTTHVVFGHRLLAGDDAATEAKVAGAAGLRLLGETGFLRLLGLAAPADDPAMSQQALLEQSGLQAPDLHLLALFDAFEHEAEPWSFRDLILARKYAGLIAGGASWAAVARSVHRVGPVASLTAKALQLEGGAICLRAGEGVSELDGQLRLSRPWTTTSTTFSPRRRPRRRPGAPRRRQTSTGATSRSIREMRRRRSTAPTACARRGAPPTRPRAMYGR